MDSNTLNIAIVNQWYPPFSYGGVAQYSEHLAKGLVERGHNVVVVSALVNRSKNYDFSDRVPVYRVQMPEIPYRFSRLPVIGRQHRFLRNLLYSNSVGHFLKTIINKHKIDLVEYAEINGEGFFHRKYLGNLPYVVRCHTPYYLLEKTYESGDMPFSCQFINWMERKTIREANGVTAPSRDLATQIEDWCDLPQGMVASIPNAIDTEWVHPDPNYHEEDILKVLFVGRIERAKGIFVLADAIPKVLAEHENVKFIFTGAPRTPKALDELTNDLNQSDSLPHCEFTGSVPKEKLRELYQQCDIFVNPSTIYESFSYTNAEAMACGKPVVTSDMGGMPETVGDLIGGLVFHSKNSGDLSVKLCDLIKDASLRKRLGQKARERSMNYSKEIVADKLIVLYENLVSGEC